MRLLGGGSSNVPFPVSPACLVLSKVYFSRCSDVSLTAVSVTFFVPPVPVLAPIPLLLTVGAVKTVFRASVDFPLVVS